MQAFRNRKSVNAENNSDEIEQLLTEKDKTISKSRTLKHVNSFTNSIATYHLSSDSEESDDAAKIAKESGRLNYKGLKNPLKAE